MNYLMLVNRDNNLNETFIPDNLIETDSKYKNNILLEEKTYQNFKKMQADAKKNNYDIDIMSGYRDYKYQEKLYNKLLKEKGLNYTIRSVAKPGCSEHHTGLALDFCIYKDNRCYIEHEITDMLETKWIHQNCHKYGFIVRYPFEKEQITNINYEPWHLRYLGDKATYLYNNNLTLEEFWK